MDSIDESKIVHGLHQQKNHGHRESRWSPWFRGTHYSIKSPVPCNYFCAILASRLQEGVRSTLALTVTSHGHSSVTRLDVRGSWPTTRVLP